MTKDTEIKIHMTAEDAVELFKALHLVNVFLSNNEWKRITHGKYGDITPPILNWACNLIARATKGGYLLEEDSPQEYTPSTDDLKRRGVPSAAEYLQAAIQDDTDAKVYSLDPLEEIDIRKLERTLTEAPEAARAGMLQILPLIGITAYERESKWHILRPNEALIF